MKYMPPGIVDFDHSETVNALAQGQVAMICEWSAFYKTLTEPDVEGQRFARHRSRAEGSRRPQAGARRTSRLPSPVRWMIRDKGAAWLFIQWITSKAKGEGIRRKGRCQRSSVHLQGRRACEEVPVHSADG